MIRRTSAVALLAVSILGLTACGSSNDPLASDTPPASSSASGGSGGPIVVGGANFSESTLLAEIYAGALRAKGVDASTKLNIGSREIYLRALEDNSVQVFPEYTGALAFNYDKDYTGTDPDEVYQHVQEVLPDSLVVLDKSAAEDNDSMVVTKETAAEKNLKTVDDLKAVAGDLTLTAPPEFKERPQGIPGLEKTYGITFKSFRPLTGQGIVQALKNGQADVGEHLLHRPGHRGQRVRGPRGHQEDVRLAEHRAAGAGRQADAVKEALNAVSAKLTTEAISGCSSRPTSTRRTPRPWPRSSSPPTGSADPDPRREAPGPSVGPGASSWSAGSVAVSCTSPGAWPRGLGWALTSAYRLVSAVSRHLPGGSQGCGARFGLSPRGRARRAARSSR